MSNSLIKCQPVNEECQIPHGIYIHIPFCVRKCPYCDFYSTSDISFKPLFLESLIKEIGIKSSLRLPADTVYLGGGTPSILAASDIRKILDAVTACFSLTTDVQITMEVNPGTVNGDYLAEIRSHGVNRLSIGVQSFHDDKLRFLGRIHTALESENAIEEARRAGFDDLGLDLMYGLIGETESTWLEDMDKALAFSPEHLSCYMLTYEPGTPMYHRLKTGDIESLDDDNCASMFLTTASYMSSRGYCHYEISNFASSNQHRSRHNMKYWQMVPYMGFGPSAHSFDLKTRYWNHRDVAKYIDDLEHGKLPRAGQEFLTKEQKLTEMILVGLRTSEGIDINEFEKISCSNFKNQFKDVIKRLEKQNWCKWTPDHFSLTIPGMVYLDTAVEWFADNIL